MSKEIKKLLELAKKHESVYKDVSIKEATSLIEALDKKKDPTSEERTAGNVLIVAFLHSGDEDKAQWSRDTFFERNQGFIGLMIDRYFSAWCPKYYNDLYQSGVVGLLEALNRFDPVRSPTGSSTSWATRWVIHELCLQVNYNAMEASLASQIMAAKNDLRDRGIPDDNIDGVMISSESGIPLSRVLYGLDVIDRKVVSLEEGVDFIAESSNPQDQALDTERSSILYEALDQLTDLAKKCMVMYFGLGEIREKMSANEIASELGMNVKDVQFQIADAVQRLRENPKVVDLAVRRTITEDDNGGAEARLFKKII